VLAVLSARDRADYGVADSTLEDVLEEWRAPGFDREHDAVVHAGEDGTIDGYAAVERRGTLVAVAPDRERRGIGSELLDWVRHRRSERGWREDRQGVGERNERAAALLRAAGYERVRSYWRMVLALEVSPAPVVPVDGIELRPLRPAEDAEPVYALDLAAFTGAPDYVPETLEEFRSANLHSHDLDPALSAVALRGERFAGFLLARRWEQESAGYVAILAVHPEEQGRGIGRALLTRAFAAFREAGLAEAQLGVASDNSGALRLYEGLGMRPRFRRDLYELAG